jgi:hypothetical protein
MFDLSPALDVLGWEPEDVYPAGVRMRVSDRVSALLLLLRLTYSRSAVMHYYNEAYYLDSIGL